MNIGAPEHIIIIYLVFTLDLRHNFQLSIQRTPNLQRKWAALQIVLTVNFAQ